MTGPMPAAFDEEAERKAFDSFPASDHLDFNTWLAARRQSHAEIDKRNRLLLHILNEVCALEDFDAESLRQEIMEVLRGEKMFTDYEFARSRIAALEAENRELRNPWRPISALKDIDDSFIVETEFGHRLFANKDYLLESAPGYGRAVRFMRVPENEGDHG